MNLYAITLQEFKDLAKQGELKTYSHFREFYKLITKLLDKDDKNTSALKNGRELIRNLEDYLNDSPNANSDIDSFLKQLESLDLSDNAGTFTGKYSEFANLLLEKSKEFLLKINPYNQFKPYIDGFNDSWVEYIKQRNIKYYNYEVLFYPYTVLKFYINSNKIDSETKKIAANFLYYIEKAIESKTGLRYRGIKEISSILKEEVKYILKKQG
ncbi:hypothetical protein HGG64_01510 [Mycoplasma phocoeninasale]|uniref:Uncharacterized protein n=1 Tax=Mycoplasma phocoeninasale TaxID=2726117 RepID=A0A858U554_9MOLU|nr:hypothetical protein [Mycoplasma phocoeninasale]QJG66385.1 hypothetical protein HGG64_01510 [Mycoplasma phocoeninasale]